MGEVAVDVNDNWGFRDQYLPSCHSSTNSQADRNKNREESYLMSVSPGATTPAVSVPETPEVFSGESPARESPQDTWLPITESRNGDLFSCVFHLLSSGIGYQALLLPVALASLGWTWGIICLSLAFSWQLYTMWLLVHLHESPSGTRYSRFLRLAITAFGAKLGKILGIFPVMYLSGGSCVVLIITGGGAMKLFYEAICSDGATCHGRSLNGVEWFLVFTCIAIGIAQLPNLNSITRVSLIGAITAVGYCALIWALSVGKGRPSGTTYHRPTKGESDLERICDVLNGIGIVALSFRGHNLVLEIQGTLPTNPKSPTHKTMWRGVIISYAIIAISLFSLAIAGFWAYGINVPATPGGLLLAFTNFHDRDTSKYVTGLIYLIVAVNSLSSFQIYAMPVFDNLELRYVTLRKRRCPTFVRVGFRVFFGGLAFFIAVAFPFLGSLAGIIGGAALPLTYAYPCFMWMIMTKPKHKGTMWYLNLVLGCLGAVFSVVLVSGAVWTVADKGLDANFFRPH